MISLSVTPDDPETKRYEREVKKLQSNVGIGSDFISGNLMYNEKYTGIFPSTPEKQEGYYLALKFDMTATDTDGSDISSNYEIVVEIPNHDNGPVVVDDGWCVFRLEEKDKKLHVFARRKSDQKVFAETFYNLESLHRIPKAEDE